MSEPSSERDPLARPPVPLGTRVGIGAALVAAAVVLHVVATAGISGASWVIGLGGDVVATVDEPVEVEIVDDQPVEDDTAEDEEAVEDEVVEEEEAVEDEVAKDDPEPDPKPDTKPDPRTRPAPDPNPDPTPQPADKPQPQRVVGIGFESTVTGGDGPAYATGNTRTGKTARTAVDPRKVDKRTAPPPPPPEPPGPNRTASDIPGSKAVVVKPKRVSKVKPTYPEILRARGIEGTVVVRVSIDARGRVTEVQIVAAAKHDELNQAAREAALREQFSPATKNGAPIPFSLSFSYRFRLSDA